MKKFQIEWASNNEKPQCPPNPMYPNGVVLDLTNGKLPACTASLPYPAKCIGVWIVRCLDCGIIAGCTAAG